MDFRQPDYGLASGDWRKNINFIFKKSVFFFENLLVCLGSNIRAQNTNGKVVQTTLFQDKLVSGVSSSLIKVNGVGKTYSSTFTAETPSSADRSYTTLTDAKGNFYYVPNPSKLMLKVHLQDQNSKKGDGETDTSGRYGTAWFQHGTSTANYEYAVLIPTTSYYSTFTNFPTAQETTGSEIYKVLLKTEIAHVVQFRKSPKSWSDLSQSITGYVMFAPSTALPPDGPVESVNKGNCLIMAEKATQFIYLSISSPSLNLPTTTDPLTNSDDVEQEELYQASSQAREIEVKLKYQVQKSIVYVQVHGKPDCYKPNVWVLSDQKTIRFLNLRNGFSVEVKLKRKTV